MRRPRIDHRLSSHSSKGSAPLQAPWPSWEYSSNPAAKRTINYSRSVPSTVLNLAKQFNETLYLLRLEHRPDGLKNYYFNSLTFLRFIATLPTHSRPTCISQIDTELVKEFISRMCGAEIERPFIHSSGQKTIEDCGRYVLRTVKSAWRLGILKGNLRPNLGRLKAPKRGSSLKPATIDVYTDGEHERIVRSAVACKSAGRGQTYSDERVYLAACCVLIACFVPANVAGIVGLNEDSLANGEFDQKHDVLTVMKWRPVEKATKIPEPKLVERGIHKGKGYIRQIFDENKAWNSKHDIQDGGGKPLFICLYPGKQKNQSYIGRLNAVTLKSGLKTLSERSLLQDDNGAPLVISLRKLRRSYPNRSKDKRNVESSSKALGHADVNTTASSYIAVTSEDHRNFVNGLRAISVALNGTNETILILASNIGLSPELIEGLASGMRQTYTASCTDNHDGKYAPKDGTGCRHLFTCFLCPNMAVAVGDLYRLASLAKRIEDDIRLGLLTSEAAGFFSSIRSIILNDIFPLFEKRHVEGAIKKAAKNLHVLWARITLHPKNEI